MAYMECLGSGDFNPQRGCSSPDPSSRSDSQLIGQERPWVNVNRTHHRYPTVIDSLLRVLLLLRKKKRVDD